MMLSVPASAAVSSKPLLTWLTAPQHFIGYSGGTFFYELRTSETTEMKQCKHQTVSWEWRPSWQDRTSASVWPLSYSLPGGSCRTAGAWGRQLQPRLGDQFLL